MNGTYESPAASALGADDALGGGLLEAEREPMASNWSADLHVRVAASGPPQGRGI